MSFFMFIGWHTVEYNLHISKVFLCFFITYPFFYSIFPVISIIYHWYTRYASLLSILILIVPFIPYYVSLAALHCISFRIVIIPSNWYLYFAGILVYLYCKISLLLRFIFVFPLRHCLSYSFRAIQYRRIDKWYFDKMAYDSVYIYDLKIGLLMIRKPAHGWTKMSKK